MIDELVFVGFNSRVAALDRRNGQIVWDWKAPSGRGYVTVLLDGDTLFVSVNGYQYGLDPGTGAELWFNQMSGFGYGVSALATTRGHSAPTVIQAAAEEAEQSSSSTPPATAG